MINGMGHGPVQGRRRARCTCATSRPSSHIYFVPWRAMALPLIRDLVVDRSALDRIITAGGYISTNTGGVRDANAILIPKRRVS